MKKLRFLVQLVVVAFLSLLQPAEGTKYFKTFAGPYWAMGTKQYSCPKNVAPTDWYNISVRFLNFPRTHLEQQFINFKIDLADRVDDSDQAVLRLDSWLNNQWKENAVAKITLPHASSSWRQFMPEIAEKVFTEVPKHPAPCVLNAGKNSAEKEPLNWTFPQVPYFYYGEYRIQILVSRKRQPRLCTMVEVKVLPKAV